MGRGRRVDVCVDGAWFTREEDFLVVGIMGKRLEKQTNFLCNFISFHSGMYARAQWVFFISGFSSCTRESANCVHF